MPRGRVPFRQADVKRAVSGVTSSGLKVSRVEIEGTKITVFAGDAAAPLPTSDFDSWRAKRDARSA